MSRTDTMPGYNHIELDEVHTPSRYFAPAFICFSWEVHLILFMLRIKSCFPVSFRVLLSGTSVRLARAAGQLDKPDIRWTTSTDRLQDQIFRIPH